MSSPSFVGRHVGAAAAMLVLAVSASAASAAALADPIREDFEAADAADRWTIPASLAEDGLTIARDGAAARLGVAGLRIDASSLTGGESTGLVSTEFAATDFAGRRVRLTAWIDVAGPVAATAQPWIRVHRPDGAFGAFDDGGRVSVESGAGWTRRTLEIDVAADAERFTVGMLLFRGAVASLDDLEIADIGEARPVPAPAQTVVPFAAAEGQPAKALTDRGRRNLVVFARLVGWARFFNPADGTDEVDWDAVLVRAIPWIEDAADDAELAARAAAVLDPRAPGIRIWSGRKHEGPPASPRVLATESVMWRHRGFASPTLAGPSIYASSRDRFSADALPESGPDRMALLSWIPPGHEVEAELAPGFFARMSVHLPVRDGRSVPSATTTDAEAGIEGAGGDDRSIRLASVIRAWNVMQHFFPYHDVTGTDWEAELGPALDAAAIATDIRGAVHAVARMVDGLHDGHVNVHHRSLRPASLLGGSWRWIDEGVVCVEPGTNGARAGLERGDVLVALDDVRIADWMVEVDARTSGSDGWVRSAAITDLVLRETNGPVRMRVVGADGSERSLRFDPAPFIADGMGQLSRPGNVAEIEPGIWYVDLDRVVEAELRAALGDLASADGIVLDIRGYPDGLGPWILQHLASVPLHSASWRIPIVRLPDRRHFEYATSRWYLRPESPRLTSNVAWLIDGGSISYAESLSGIVDKHGLATIVGEPTAGSNGNVTTLQLPGGAFLSWTGMRVVAHDETAHHVTGVRPHVWVQPTVAGIREGRDEVLEAGLEIVRAGRD